MSGNSLYLSVQLEQIISDWIDKVVDLRHVTTEEQIAACQVRKSDWKNLKVNSPQYKHDSSCPTLFVRLNPALSCFKCHCRDLVFRLMVRVSLGRCLSVQWSVGQIKASVNGSRTGQSTA